jgi:hypothetical protein
MALAHAFVVEQQPQPRAELVHRTSEAAAAAREKRGARISAAAPRGS